MPSTRLISGSRYIHVCAASPNFTRSTGSGVWPPARVVVPVVLGQQRLLDHRLAGQRRRQPRHQRLDAERLLADAHRAGGHEEPIALGASGDVVGLVQPLGAQLPLGRVEVHDVVRLVLDARELDFLDRAARRRSAAHAAASAAGNCDRSTGPPVNASPSTSSPAALVHSNGSIESRPLNAHVSANTPKTAPVR